MASRIGPHSTAFRLAALITLSALAVSVTRGAEPSLPTAPLPTDQWSSAGEAVVADASASGVIPAIGGRCPPGYRRVPYPWQPPSLAYPPGFATPDLSGSITDPGAMVTSPDGGSAGAAAAPAPAPEGAAPDMDALADAGSPPSGIESARSTPDAGLASAPNMFGDSFFTSGQILGITEMGIVIPMETGGLIDIPGMRVAKIAENNSPLPRDRVYFMHHHFHNAISGSDFSWINGEYSQRLVDYSVNRSTLGFEKTFLDGVLSADIRIPFQDSIEFSAGMLDLQDLPPAFTSRTESGALGDISLALKALLFTTSRSAISAGLMLTAPTAPDVIGEQFLMQYRLENEAVHLAPFIGALYQPGSDWFFQSFVQVDVDPNGNPLLITPFDEEDVLEAGVLQDQTLLYVDLSAGRWLVRRPRQYLLTGVAALAELHYTTTLQHADEVDYSQMFDYLVVGNLDNRVDVMNLTAGLHFELRNGMNLRAAMVTPLRESEDNRCFDSELNVQANWYF